MVSRALLALVAFLISLIVTPAVREVAVGLNWVDSPDYGKAGARKLHRVPIPRLGGVAIFIAYAASLLAVMVLPLQGGRIVEQEFGLVIRLGPAVLVIFIVGLVVDVWGLPAWQKLLGQLAAAGVAHAAGVALLSFGGRVLLGWAQPPLTLA